MTGNFGLLDLTVNSSLLVCSRSKPCGKVNVALKDLPGCGSAKCTSTSLASMAGSESAIVLVALLFWMVMAKDCLAASGPEGKVSIGGLIVTACWTLAQAVMACTGEFDEDLRVIWPCTLPASSGGTVAIVTSYSLPGVLVLSCAVKALLLLSGSHTWRGVSM